MKKSGTEMANLLLEFVNSYGFDIRGFSDTITRAHPTLQQSVMRLFMATIEKWADKDNTWDERNANTIMAAKSMVSVTKDITFPMI